MGAPILESDSDVLREEMKRKISIVAACVVAICAVVLLLVPAPVEGYYRSQAATYLDGESRGYLYLHDGVVEIVNVGTRGADTQPFGPYTTAGRHVSIATNMYSSNTFTGTTYLWGIHWSAGDQLDRFTRRAYPKVRSQNKSMQATPNGAPDG